MQNLRALNRNGDIEFFVGAHVSFSQEKKTDFTYLRKPLLLKPIFFLKVLSVFKSLIYTFFDLKFGVLNIVSSRLQHHCI